MKQTMITLFWFVLLLSILLLDGKGSFLRRNRRNGKTDLWNLFNNLGAENLVLEKG